MDIDYNAVFGLENTGAEEQEVTEPAPDTETEGAEEQEVTEPAEDTAEQEESSVPDTKDTQSAEENSRFAAARRKAERERDLAVKRAKDDAKKELDGAIKSLGIKDPFSGKLIETKAEYDEYVSRQSEEKRNRFLRRNGISDEEFAELVDDIPEVREARAQATEAKAEAERLKTEEAKRRVDEQLAEVSKLNPDIKSLSDLSKMPTYPAFYEAVQKGISIIDAYKLANYDSLMSNAASISRRQTLNAVNGKGHLSKTETRGTGAVTVPADVRDAYRIMNPNATDAEIERHYNKYIKR